MSHAQLMCLRSFWLVKIEAAAHNKHGGPEGVEEARKSSIDHRQEKRATKRKQDNEKVPTLRNYSSKSEPFRESRELVNVCAGSGTACVPSPAHKARS